MSLSEFKLGELATFRYGKALPEEERAETGYPVFSSAGIVDYCPKFLVEKGIIVGRKGNAGSVYFSDEPFFAIDTTFFIDDVSAVTDIKFLFYLLGAINLNHFAGDAAVPGLNREVAESIKIKIPSLPVQQRIAEILGRYDDLIENYDRQIGILESTAQNIYREWFVRGRCPYAIYEGDSKSPVDWNTVNLVLLWG